jgi:hypothetical protein
VDQQLFACSSPPLKAKDIEEYIFLLHISETEEL